MASSELDIKYIARLARLALTPEEEKRFGAQLGQVLEYFDKLKQADVTGVEPTAHVMPLVNVTRPDQARPSLPHADALANAPATSGGLFQVPRIIE